MYLTVSACLNISYKIIVMYIFQVIKIILINSLAFIRCFDIIFDGNRKTYVSMVPRAKLNSRFTTSLFARYLLIKT